MESKGAIKARAQMKRALRQSKIAGAEREQGWIFDALRCLCVRVANLDDAGLSIDHKYVIQHAKELRKKMEKP